MSKGRINYLKMFIRIEPIDLVEISRIIREGLEERGGGLGRIMASFSNVETADRRFQMDVNRAPKHVPVVVLVVIKSQHEDPATSGYQGFKGLPEAEKVCPRIQAQCV